MRTSNPVLSDKIFQQAGSHTGTNAMTINGTIQKSFFLILLVLVAAGWAWQQAYPQGWGADIKPTIPFWFYPSIIGAFILAIIIAFKQTAAPYLAPVYAILQGLGLGAISVLFEVQFPGIVIQAVLCTTGVFIAMLAAYRFKFIEVTQNFRLGVMAATGGIALVYLISFVMGFFGIQMPYLHDASPLGIGISLFIVVVAALNLVLDFDFIDRGAAKGAPKYMEWYASFGLLVTLVWLYIEMLRLLSKTRR